MRRLLLAALLAAACGPTPPTPVPIAKTEPTKAAEPTKAPEPAKAPDTKVAAQAGSTARAPEPPLTQEELDLIAADPATLTPEKRRARAFALRRKCLQNPEGACARQLEEVRSAVESGALVPQLPEQTTPTKSGDLVLTAPTKAEPGKAGSGTADSGKTQPAAPAEKSP